MRWQSTAVVVLGYSTLLIGHARGDDLKINTPVVSASLSGKWELQPESPEGYKQTLLLGKQLAGEWRKSRESLPVSIAWFVEGGELRILHYFEPNGAFNYRVKTRMIAYELNDDTLTLSLDGKPTAWKRIKTTAPAKP